MDTPPTRRCIRVAELRPEYDTLVDWLLTPNHIYIGRFNRVKGAAHSPWANPYPLSKYTVDESLALYKQHVINRELDVSTLGGLVLGCWCPPNARCHADVLIEL